MSDRAPDMTAEDVGPEGAHGLQGAIAPAPKKRGPRTDRLAHVRRGLSRVYRELAAWNPPELKPAEKIARARALGSLLTSIAEVLRSDELERRLQVLEEAARGIGRH